MIRDMWMWKTVDRSVFQLLRDLYCIFKPKSLTLERILVYGRISFNQTFSRPKFCVESISAAHLPQKIRIFPEFKEIDSKISCFSSLSCRARTELLWGKLAQKWSTPFKLQNGGLLFFSTYFVFQTTYFPLGSLRVILQNINFTKQWWLLLLGNVWLPSNVRFNLTSSNHATSSTIWRHIVWSSFSMRLCRKCAPCDNGIGHVRPRSCNKP